ncbi:MAG: DegT/DnrJ/EryC1/StrS family aminotransferase [Fimbriimonadaceae bacterium]|nr:DegT/DnrJ/EryC1/StrS family aminotransferase [Fimbriimonadaceae bacterium]
MAIRMLDIQAQLVPIQDQLEAAATKVLRRGHFVLGEEVEALEHELATYCGARYGVGVASGTDALLLALAAVGVTRGSQVITTPFTYVATVQAVTHLGATPVFVDIDPQTFNLDAEQVQRAVGRRTKAIIPVHLFGQCAEMDPICDLAARRGLAVVEDSAQAVGATYHGRGACSLGHLGCLSFYPTKNLGACGDGGMVLTNDEELYQRLRLLRVHGRADGYFYLIDGFNSRLDEIQAAFLRVKMRGLREYTAARQRNAALYDELLADLPQIRTPYVPAHNVHVYHQYSIIAERRDDLREYLKAHGIDSAVYYPLPLHQQEIYRHFRRRLPVAEWTCQHILALPIAPEVVTTDGVRTVSEAIRAFYRK